MSAKSLSFRQGSVRAVAPSGRASQTCATSSLRFPCTKNISDVQLHFFASAHLRTLNKFMCKRVNLPIYFVYSVYVVNVIYNVYVVYIAIRVCNVIVVYGCIRCLHCLHCNRSKHDDFPVNMKKDTPARVPQFYSVFKRLVLHFSYRMLSIFSHGVFQMIENAFPRNQSVFLVVT